MVKLPPVENLELGNYTTSSEAPASSTIVKRIESYLSRINYDYKSTYFLSASARRDGNSFFASDKRWANFWSVGGAWRISKEEFFHVSLINELKLKASYGKVGNDAVGSYAYQGGYIQIIMARSRVISMLLFQIKTLHGNR